MNEIQYLHKDDVMRICGVSSSKAYQLIRSVNKELEAQGKITLAGKVPASYFKKKLCLEVTL